jgi:ABC-type polysaccharide transport system permease subunit
MIQRIQTIFLILAAATSGGLIFLVSLWIDGEGNEVVAMDEGTYFSCFVLSAVISIFAIFLFRNRKLQTVVNRVNILINLILLGVFVYRALTMSGATAVAEKGIGMFIPILSIVLLVLANRAIRKDEQLVKSVDRLR